MAKKTELGLELSGKDAQDFKDHLKNPSYTPRTEQMLKHAYDLSKARGGRANRK
jgi:hypothetical protein